MKAIMDNVIIDDEVPTCSNIELFNERYKEKKYSYKPLFKSQELIWIHYNVVISHARN